MAHLVNSAGSEARDPQNRGNINLITLESRCDAQLWEVWVWRRRTDIRRVQYRSARRTSRIVERRGSPLNSCTYFAKRTRLFPLHDELLSNARAALRHIHKTPSLPLRTTPPDHGTDHSPLTALLSAYMTVVVVVRSDSFAGQREWISINNNDSKQRNQSSLKSIRFRRNHTSQIEFTSQFEIGNDPRRPVKSVLILPIRKVVPG